MTDTSQDASEQRDWRFEDPMADFERDDWRNLAVTMLLMLGIGGVCAAVAIRVAFADAMPPGCGTGTVVRSVGDNACAEYIQTVNHYIEWTMWPGATMLLAGAYLQRRWIDE